MRAAYSVGWLDNQGPEILAYLSHYRLQSARAANHGLTITAECLSTASKRVSLAFLRRLGLDNHGRVFEQGLRQADPLLFCGRQVELNLRSANDLWGNRPRLGAT